MTRHRGGNIPVVGETKFHSVLYALSLSFRSYIKLPPFTPETQPIKKIINDVDFQPILAQIPSIVRSEYGHFNRKFSYSEIQSRKSHLSDSRRK